MTEIQQQAKAGTPSSATMIIGLSGAGKSSLLATLMEYLWETQQKISLYYLCDGGGFPTQIQALIRLGICRVWRMRSRSGPGLAFETCQRASEGWWPSRIDPLTGNTAPTVRLVPPVTEKFEVRCAQGHHLTTVPFQSLLRPTLCPVCKTMADAKTWQITRASHRTKGFESVGGVFYDGLSSMCSWMMDDLSKRNDLGGEKSRLGGTVASGDLIYGENNRAQVGFTQNRAEQLILNAQGIPGLVIAPVWTALTHETSDEGGLSVRGPLIAGQAKTSVAPQWVGNLLEAIVVERDGKKYRRLNLNEWIDANGTRHLCKVRAFPGTMPAFLEDEETDDPKVAKFQNFNLGTFQRLLDAALATNIEMYQGKYPDAPGIATGEVDYGEENRVEAAAPVAAPTAPLPAPAPRPVPAPAPKAAPAVPTPKAPTPAPAASHAAPKAPAVPVGAGNGSPVAPPTRPVPPTPRATAPTPSVAATGPAPAPIAPPKPPARATTPPPPGRRPVS